MPETSSDRDTVQDLPSPIRTTLTTEVLDIIRKAIVDGLFKAGQQLTESRLAKQFNVSRAPIREALCQLENTGLVVHFPHRGYFVRAISLEEIDELFQLRAALEGLAVRLLVERADVDEIETLEEIVRKMEMIESNVVEIRATELDAEFHDHLCRMSGNRHLEEVWRSLHSQIRIAVLAANSSFPLYDGFAEGHRDVLEAIKKCDPDLAHSVLVRHIDGGLENLRLEIERNEKPHPAQTTK